MRPAGMESPKRSAASGDALACAQAIGSGRSDGVDRELLDDRVCQQFGRQFGDPNHPGLRVCWWRYRLPGPSLGGALIAGMGRINGVRYLHFETLPLANGHNLGETEPVARTGDSLPLRITDLGLEHDVDNYLGHSTQRTRTGHLTGREERRVLSQRSQKTMTAR
jgi:hypothetical protein